MLASSDFDAFVNQTTDRDDADHVRRIVEQGAIDARADEHRVGIRIQLLEDCGNRGNPADPHRGFARW